MTTQPEKMIIAGFVDWILKNQNKFAKFVIMTKIIHRSAVTGKIVTEEFAKQNPDTTVKETILNHKLDPIELRVELMAFCDFLEENGRPIDYSLIDEYFKGK